MDGMGWDGLFAWRGAGHLYGSGPQHDDAPATATATPDKEQIAWVLPQEQELVVRQNTSRATLSIARSCAGDLHGPHSRWALALAVHVTFSSRCSRRAALVRVAATVPSTSASSCRPPLLLWPAPPRCIKGVTFMYGPPFACRRNPGTPGNERHGGGSNKRRNAPRVHSPTA